MPEIEVKRTDVDRSLSRFEVRVDEMSYVVTLSAPDWERLRGASESAEAFVRMCFEFLLEREPASQILKAFDIRQIATYFPEFEGEIAARTSR